MNCAASGTPARGCSRASVRVLTGGEEGAGEEEGEGIRKFFEKKKKKKKIEGRNEEKKKKKKEERRRWEGEETVAPLHGET